MRTHLSFVRIILVGAALIGAFALFTERQGSPVQAGSDDNVSGFAWSETIGWISFNCTDTNTCLGIDYGVNVDQSGNFQGYAWSEYIGWIRFDPPGSYPGEPNSSAAFNRGNNQVSGWVRACAAAADPQNCSGGANSNSGGWDGWIKLRKHSSDGDGTPDYGVSYDPATGEFHGWAWGSDVVGWISFNCAEGGATGDDICSSSNYKVVGALNQAPTAAFSCDPSDCTVFEKDTLKFVNNSTDIDSNIATSEWDILSFGASPDVTCPPGSVVCDYTLQVVPPATYTMRLTVTDAVGASASVDKSFTVKPDTNAGFMCSFDNAIWVACANLSGKISRGEVVYLKDDPALAEYSTPSEGGTSITSRTWARNGSAFSTGNDTNPSTTLSDASNIITLTVTDNQKRTDATSHTITTQLPFPEWQEISPF